MKKNVKSDSKIVDGKKWTIEEMVADVMSALEGTGNKKKKRE